MLRRLCIHARSVCTAARTEREYRNLLRKEKCSIVGLFDNGDTFQNEFNDAADLNPGIGFIKVHAEDFPDLFQKTQVSTTPAILPYFDGEPINSTVGADAEALKLLIDELKDEAVRRERRLPNLSGLNAEKANRQRECTARDPALRGQWETSPHEASNLDNPLSENANLSESNANSTGILKIATTLKTGFSEALTEQALCRQEFQSTTTETYIMPPRRRRSRRNRAQHLSQQQLSTA